jgi:hypothetical protein
LAEVTIKSRPLSKDTRPSIKDRLKHPASDQGALCIIHRFDTPPKKSLLINGSYLLDQIRTLTRADMAPKPHTKNRTITRQPSVSFGQFQPDHFEQSGIKTILGRARGLTFSYIACVEYAGFRHWQRLKIRFWGASRAGKEIILRDHIVRIAGCRLSDDQLCQLLCCAGITRRTDL